jgi:chromosome segregation ATPase
VQLPRALANEKGYAQHVSPFAPVTVLPPGPSTSTPRDLEKAKLRIQGLVKERNYYQRTLRKATSVDTKTGKTILESLQTQNTALRRTNSKLARDNEDLKQKVQAASQSYAALVEQYNQNIQQLHRAQLELKQLGK